MKTRGIIKLLEEIKNSVDNAGPHHLIFKPTGKLNKEEIERLQKSLDESFRIWAESWIYPNLNHIIEYLEQYLNQKRKAPHDRTL